MDINLSEEEQGPVYLVLYRHLRKLIQSGALADGTKLPSIRSLREQSKLSKTTIETAYHMLLEEGYAVSKPRAGLFVIQSQLTPAAAMVHTEILEEKASIHRHSIPLPTQNGTVIDFSLLAVDGESFPIRAWKSVLHDALSHHASNVHQYGDPRGEYDLRLQLSYYLKRSRGVNCTPEQIIIGSGFSYSTQILAKLLNGASTIAVEEAGIAQVRAAFQQHGYNVAPVPVHNMENFVSILVDKQIQILYVTPSHRPNGSSLPYSTRQLLLHWASTNSAYIIEDDYDGEFRYSGKTIPSLQGMDHQGSVIYIGTFSKAFTPALRMNYMVVPTQLLSKLQAIEHTLTSPSRIDQWAMQLFMERGHWYRHVRKVRNLYRKKRAKLLQLIDTYLPEHVQVHGDSAGMHVEIAVQTTCSAEELIKLAASEDVYVYAAQDTPILPGRFARLYLGFGGVNEKEMERGLRRLVKAWAGALLPNHE
ncbi:PLP-dependent aminotransferase family protein [Paenibacillus sp. MCAF9]|uniref:MocR-like pyridoxine biosynthesis transcription factor PdxR n=1 Tax=Paenibacillus sp. MCAF9 TaxID=3233046 RepID=UPI003F9AD5FC